MAFKSCPF